MVTVRVDIRSCVFEGLDKVFAPKHEAVGYKSADLPDKLSARSICTARRFGTHSSISHEHGVSKGARHPRDTVYFKRVLIQGSARENRRRRVGCSVCLLKRGRHEGQRFRAPNVGVVDAQHGGETYDESSGLVGLQTQRKRGLERGDLCVPLLSASGSVGSEFESSSHILPVEGQGE